MARSRRNKALVRAIKAVLGVVVLVAAGRHVAATLRDLDRQGERPRLDPAWMALAVVLYVAGLVVFGLWYWRILKASATPIARLPALRAYIISHLGKYVPGKAMVVVVRAGLSAPAGARPATAAFASFYETLVMMAAGALMAALGFATARGVAIEVPLGGLGTYRVPAWLVALGPGLAFLVLAWPPVFAGLMRGVSLPLPGVGPDALPRLEGRLLLEGLAWCLLGWSLWGLSQVAVIRALVPGGLPASAWPLAMASVALATVAGFVVAVAPGGLGVREWVLWTALGAALSPERAVIASLALRLAWVIGEVAGAAILAPIRLPRPAPSPAPPGAEPL